MKQQPGQFKSPLTGFKKITPSASLSLIIAALLLITIGITINNALTRQDKRTFAASNNLSRNNNSSRQSSYIAQASVAPTIYCIGSCLTSAPTQSITKKVPPPCADLNTDGVINYKDVGIVGSVLNSCNGNANFNAKYDINGDGCINQKDVDILNTKYGQSTTCSQATVCPDIDSDGTVNYKELGRIGAAFNTCSGDAKYNSLADLNGDNCVNNGDLLIVDKYFNVSRGDIPACTAPKKFP